MKVQEISHLINVRDFTHRIINGIEVKMTGTEVKTLRMKLIQMDRILLQHLLEVSFDQNTSSVGNPRPL